MTEAELTPADYIAMLRRRWVLIAVLAAVGGPLAYGVSRFLPEPLQVADTCAHGATDRAVRRSSNRWIPRTSPSDFRACSSRY